MFVCKFESAKGKSVVLSLFTQGHFFDFWLPLKWKLRTYLIILNAFLISNRPNHPKSRIYVNPAQNTQNDCHWYVYTGTYTRRREIPIALIVAAGYRVNQLAQVKHDRSGAPFHGNENSWISHPIQRGLGDLIHA